MKPSLKKIIKIIVYFFTPEDSATPIQHPTLSFNIKHNQISIGSAKALFWVMNSMILVCLMSLL